VDGEKSYGGEVIGWLKRADELAPERRKVLPR